MPKPNRTRSGTTLEAYEQLLQLNAGFEQVLSSLAALSTNPAFNRAQLRILQDRAQEARACANAYLTEVLQQTESEEAGRCFTRRTRRERRQERSG